jgi:uncharacterized protein
MKIIRELLYSLAGCDHPVRRVMIGLHWVAVESRYVGLAHTFRPPGKYEVADSGALVGTSALTMAQRALSWNPLEASLGLAALNSLIEAVGRPGNVFDRIPQLAGGRKVTVIGRFPFNDEVRKVAASGWFLEMEPRRDELPPPACEVCIPQSDLLVVSATSLINHTAPRLLELAADTHAILLGPSTPMSDVLFRHGADVLAGVAVTDSEALFQSVAQGVKSFNKLAGIVALSRDRRESGVAEKTSPRAAAMAARAVEADVPGDAPLLAAAIVHDADTSAGALLAAFAREQHQRGRKIRGLIQDKAPYGEDGSLRRALFDIDSGRCFFISQQLGSGSVSCSLDTGEMAEASGALRRGLADGAELVVVNRYGEQEAAGGGFAAEMLDLMASGVPLLTLVSEKYLADWRHFTGNAAVELPPRREAVDEWFASLPRRMECGD